MESKRNDRELRIAAECMLRNFPRVQFMKSSALQWKSHLEDLMHPTNSNQDLITIQSSHVLVKHLQSLHWGILVDYTGHMSVAKRTPIGWRNDWANFEDKFSVKRVMCGHGWRTFKARYNRPKIRNRKYIVVQFPLEIYVMKGVSDRRVNKSYTLMTQVGDSTFLELLQKLLRRNIGN